MYLREVFIRSDMAIERNDPCHFHINLRIAVNGEGSAKEKSLGAISLTRQLEQECAIENLRESCREGSVRDKSSSRG